MRATKSVVVTCLCLFALFGTNPANATQVESGNNVLLSAGRAVDDDLMVAGNNVQIQSWIIGDALIAGNNIVIGKPVSSDVTAVGMNVSLSAPIGDDLRAFGSTVTVMGPVGDNAQIAGGTVILDTDANIGHDADLAGGTITVKAPIHGNLRLSAGEASIYSEVQGSVRANTEHLTLQPEAVIHGNLMVTGPNPPVISPSARILGKTIYHPGSTGSDFPGGAESPASPPSVPWFASFLLQFVSLVLSGAVVMVLAPTLPGSTAQILRQRTGPAVLVGFLAMVCVPMFALLLAITLVGIPLAVVLLAAYGMLLLLTGAILAQPLGDWLVKKATWKPLPITPYGLLAIGSFVLALLTSIPGLGGIVQLGLLLAGPGAILLYGWSCWQARRPGVGEAALHAIPAVAQS